VAARPKWLGAMLISVLLMGAAQGIFFSTEVGQGALIDQQIATVKAFGATVTDQMIQQLESRSQYAAYTQPATLLVFIPIVAAVLAGLLLAIFTAILGGGATFKQVYAVVAHSMFIGGIQQLFSFPIMYTKGEMSSPTSLSVFLPMLGEESFLNYLMTGLDIFYFWWLINLSIGVAVLYKRRTGPVAAVLLGIYAVIVLIVAVVRAF
jgi:hypothetical protein